MLQTQPTTPVEPPSLPVPEGRVLPSASAVMPSGGLLRPGFVAVSGAEAEAGSMVEVVVMGLVGAMMVLL